MLKYIVFLAILSVTYAATALQFLPEKPKELAHKEGCYVELLNDVIPFGAESKPIGDCVRISCGETMIHYATCTYIASDHECYITKGDLSKPYPDCCPKIECDSSNFVDT